MQISKNAKGGGAVERIFLGDHCRQQPLSLLIASVHEVSHQANSGEPRVPVTVGVWGHRLKIFMIRPSHLARPPGIFLIRLPSVVRGKTTFSPLLVGAHTRNSLRNS